VWHSYMVIDPLPLKTSNGESIVMQLTRVVKYYFLLVAPLEESWVQGVVSARLGLNGPKLTAKRALVVWIARAYRARKPPLSFIEVVTTFVMLTVYPPALPRHARRMYNTCWKMRKIVLALWGGAR
jgi:hypothetical protein